MRWQGDGRAAQGGRPGQADEAQRGLERYVAQLVHELGGAASPAGPDLLEVVVPPDAAALFGGRSYVKLAFDYEAQREAGDAEFVRPGSPLLDRLAAAGLELGRLLCRCVWLPRVVVPERLEERVARAVEFANGRGMRVAAAQLVELGFLAFQWRAALVGDERVEWVERVLVDLQRGLCSDWLEAVERALWEPEPSVLLPSAARVPVGQAYEAAYREAQGRAQERRRQYELQTRPLREAELAKVGQYYDGLNRQLRQRLEKAADEARRRELEAKLAANEADRRRRMEDVERKFRPTLELALDQVVWYRVPGVEARLDVRVQQSWVPVVAHYNLLTHAVEPLGCQQCGRRVRAVVVGRDGWLACQQHGSGVSGGPGREHRRANTRLYEPGSEEMV